MNSGIEEIARAFSGHQFEAAYPYLDDDVTWSLVGGRELTRWKRDRGLTGRRRGWRLDA